MPISSYAKGAQKAYRKIVKRYGSKRGRAIFYARANRLGKGKTRRAKVNSTYKKKRKRR